MTDPSPRQRPLSDREARQFCEIIEHLTADPQFARGIQHLADADRSARPRPDITGRHVTVIVLVLLGTAVLTAVVPEPANLVAPSLALLLVALSCALKGWRMERARR